MSTFNKGDRIRLSPLGKERVDIRNPDRLWTVNGERNRDGSYCIAWDGLKPSSKYYLNEVYLELAEGD